MLWQKCVCVFQSGSWRAIVILVSEHSKNVLLPEAPIPSSKIILIHKLQEEDRNIWKLQIAIGKVYLFSVDGGREKKNWGQFGIWEKAIDGQNWF